MRRYAFVLVLLIAFPPGAWADSSAAPLETFVSGFQDSRVRDMVLKQLAEKQIWYEIISANQIRFRHRDAEEIGRIAKQVTHEIIPPERSANYSVEFLKRFLKRLDAAGITYDIVQYGDLEEIPPDAQELTQDWVVWPEEKTEEVARIQKELEHDLLYGEVPQG